MRWLTRLRDRWSPPDPKLVTTLRHLLDHAPAEPWADDEAFSAWLVERAKQTEQTPETIDFLWYAVGSHRLQASVLKGARVFNDAEFEAVFRALAYIEEQSKPS